LQFHAILGGVSLTC